MDVLCSLPQLGQVLAKQQLGAASVFGGSKASSSGKPKPWEDGAVSSAKNVQLLHPWL